METIYILPKGTEVSVMNCPHSGVGQGTKGTIESYFKMWDGYSVVINDKLTVFAGRNNIKEIK